MPTNPVLPPLSPDYDPLKAMYATEDRNTMIANFAQIGSLSLSILVGLLGGLLAVMMVRRIHSEPATEPTGQGGV